MATPKLKSSVRRYDAWLREQLGGDLVVDDLIEKHAKMASEPFVFLRATYWRWAETADKFCHGLDSAPTVLAIGDVHLENFGTWRDEDGRLVWGVNDFDEAAEMPYVLDLVRLAASALLADPKHDSGREACDAIHAGYCEGLANPRPFVLDELTPWLRRAFEVSPRARESFWRKMTPPPANERGEIPRRFQKALLKALPASSEDIETWPRVAGRGSLGRPRWVAKAVWCGSPLVREAKAVVQSAWSRVHDRKATALRCEQIANGRFRSPDPKYELRGSIVVRRLSPNNRKIEIIDQPRTLLSTRMLHAMGYEIANIHRGTRGVRAVIQSDLAAQPHDWLHRSAVAAAAFVAREHRDWKAIWAREKSTPAKA